MDTISYNIKVPRFFAGRCGKFSTGIAEVNGKKIA